MATTSIIFIRNTKKTKENRIHKVLLKHGYTNLNVSDKGVTIEVESDRIDKMITEINEIDFGVAERF